MSRKSRSILTDEMIEKLRAEAPPGALVLFRLGNFYEAFGVEDAGRLASALGVARTKDEEGCVVAGFPADKLEESLERLLRNRFRVAICEPIPGQEPRFGKPRIVRFGKDF